jgi:hypothetical protein
VDKYLSYIGKMERTMKKVEGLDPYYWEPESEHKNELKQFLKTPKKCFKLKKTLKRMFSLKK